MRCTPPPGRTAFPPRLQMMVGVGRPVALQVRITLSPARTVVSVLECASSMFGASEISIK